MSKFSRNYSVSIFIGILCLLLFHGKLNAEHDADYKEGLSFYKQKKYSKAAEHFWRSITAGNASASAWLYMAHAYSAAGNKEKAIDSYKQITKIFAGKPAGKMASVALGKIGSINSTSHKSTSASSSSKFSNFVNPKTIDPNAYRKFRLVDRIITVPPNRKFNHPAVSKQSELAVRAAVRRLPPKFYKILEDGGVTISIAPNIIDKWPDMVKNNQLDYQAQNLAKEQGRCYGRDVHVWERSIVSGSLQVGNQRSTSVVTSALYHELGHAIDDCYGNYSKTKKALELHKLDVREMPSSVRVDLNYYTSDGQKGCSEACAELTSGILGARDREAIQCANYFKRLLPFVRSKITL